MVNTSRILTVSYGTFSCTLEGFDDPFSTMKSIAEYFRDLAADDRYFGAEPPTPDAEMLHRIAEREIQRRVETRVSEHGVVLRQADSDYAREKNAPAALVSGEALLKQAEDEAAAQAEKAAREAEARAAEEKAEEDRQEAARLAAEAETRRKIAETAEAARREAEEEEAAEQPVESFAARLQRIRAVVETAEDATSAEFAEDEHAEGFFAEAPIEAAFADVLEEALTGDEAREEAAEALIRAREDEARAYAPADEDTFAGEADADTEAYAEELEDELAAYEPAEEEPAAAESDEDAAISAMLGKLIRVPVTEDTEAEAILEPEAEKPDTRRPIARVIKVRRAAAAAQDGDADEPFDLEAEFAVPGESTLSDEDEAELAAELAGVEREARAAREALARALSTDAEPQRDEDREPLAIAPEEAPADRIAPRKPSLRTAFDDADMSTADTAVDRILEKTITHLESGEATRRRSAIQHLKAAVQATRADREAAIEAPDVEEEDLQEVYREDLAQVVRPRRPDAGDRPQRRLAPLVLVSEQRIDAAPEPYPASAATAQTVRPRRVTKGNLAVAEDDMPEAGALFDGDDSEAPMVAGFRAYLADQGVEADMDIIEAGIAYVTQEVGRASVTRPQLMTLVLSAIPGMTRETGLRAFGSLLRDGKIHKVKRGLFVLTEKSRFHGLDM